MIEQSKIFFLGMLTAVGLLLVMGAASGTSEIGRYQIAAWGAARGDYYRSGYYVLDTRTGKITDQGAEQTQ